MIFIDVHDPTRGAVLGLLAAVLLGPPDAAAQSPGASEVSMDSAAVQQLSQVRHPDSWGASGTFGVQLQEGRTDTRGWDLDLILHRVTPGRTLFRLDAEWRRAEFEPSPGADLITADDLRTVSLTTITEPGGFIPLIGVASWREDVPVNLDHRVMAQVGPYIGFSPGPKFHFDVAPLIGAGVQDNHGSTDSDEIFNVGGVQSITWHPSNTSTVQTYLKGHKSFENEDDYALDFNASVTAMVHQHLGLSLSYNLSVEGIHPDARGTDQHTVTAGLSVSFKSASGGS